MKKNEFDCIVIGGGHAGIEACHAAAKIGVKTALVTIRKDRIGEMSCNPAIGGLAKGQIAREVDALGGLMGLAIDATGIQFKILNSSKGPAVQAPRAQADRHKYQDWMEQRLEQTENLTIIEAFAEDIIVENNAVAGLRCSDSGVYKTQTIVVTTGTFLRGQMYMGDDWWDGGRIEEPASNKLSASLERIGLQIERLATGTPPRIDASTIDYDKLEMQVGDKEPKPFSFLNKSISQQQVPCWITYTNEHIHQLLIDNMHRAPISSGKIKGTKPRHCPSIEAKMLAYPDKKRHRIFLEPEEAEARTIYCNGLFTSVPKDVQEKMLHMMPGTENARIIRYGYGIEYDYCPPVQLRRSLETRKVGGLFMAGQINGTSGYEEAAGQGIAAGINAARKVQGKDVVIFGRDQSYIGVMIDDLLTKGIDEPYRMFTSRAEFRLWLRSDNADRRLTALGREIGLADSDRWKLFSNKLEKINELKSYLRSHRSNSMTMWKHLGQPHNSLADNLAGLEYIRSKNYIREVIDAAIIDAKYAGYMEKQNRLAANFHSREKKKIPDDIDYNQVLHLRAEARQKFSKFKPATLGQAGRISGITPADITVVQIHLKKYYRS
ncbi:MAG: tRNA uridine-5-carboxymethylaminomethyl(34) synthesis enzyme MnmG [Phycisphaerae bacterium]|nr:tRNA uridine-5-carboxymethylaminomethyl(34) synthesis enzyme MnmG [Phycisphaerae bacterium]